MRQAKQTWHVVQIARCGEDIFSPRLALWLVQNAVFASLGS